jgi:hypothetical protein
MRRHIARASRSQVAASAAQAGRDVLRGDTSGEQQAGQRVRRVDRPLARGMRVQREEELPVREVPGQRRRDEQHPHLAGQAQRVGQQQGGVPARGAVDAPFQVTDRPRAQARRSGQLLSRASVRSWRSSPANLSVGSATGSIASQGSAVLVWGRDR